MLDGELGEPAWQDAPAAGHFLQSEPREAEPATYDTEVRVLYDETHLHIGVTAFDDEPERLVVNDLSKDFNARSGDAFAVVLDTFHDNQTTLSGGTEPGSVTLCRQPRERILHGPAEGASYEHLLCLVQAEAGCWLERPRS